MCVCVRERERVTSCVCLRSRKRERAQVCVSLCLFETLCWGLCRYERVSERDRESEFEKEKDDCERESDRGGEKEYERKRVIEDCCVA